MKVSNNYVLRQVADTWIVLPLAETMVDFNGMLKLNESGAMLWRELEKGTDRASLTKLLCDTYEVTEAQAMADVDEFLTALQNKGCILPD